LIGNEISIEKHKLCQAQGSNSTLSTVFFTARLYNTRFDGAGWFTIRIINRFRWNAAGKQLLKLAG
jgi:hypothetical protein